MAMYGVMGSESTLHVWEYGQTEIEDQWQLFRGILEMNGRTVAGVRIYLP